MEISTENLGDRMLVKAVGRLDSYWADHLTGILDGLVRQGHHDIAINLAGIDYMSSIGIRVLVSFYRKLKAVAGAFTVVSPSENVRQTLEMAGLAVLFGQPAATAETTLTGRSFSSPAAQYELFSLKGQGMVCKTVGRPELLDGCRFGKDDLHELAITGNLVALGLGAFGNSYEECRERFGEFVAMAGAAACQPGDGSGTCDFLLVEADFVPRMQVLYGLACTGSFTRLLRFQAVEDRKDLDLGELCRVVMEQMEAPLACVVVAAESAGLIGAGLRRSPATGPQPDAPFSYPAMRDWLSFMSERLDAGSLVLTAGVLADRDRAPEFLRPFLRPVAGFDSPLGHLHAAPFKYRPLQKGLIELEKTVRPLFEGESAQGIVHLLADDRDPGNIEQSKLVRGACWFAPLHLEH